MTMYRLDSFYMRNSFQILAYLNTQKLGTEEAFEQASRIVYSWGRKKFGNTIKNFPWFEKLTCFAKKRDGIEFGALLQREEGLFVFRSAHPDKRIAGRTWVTDAEIRIEGDRCRFAVKQSVTSPQSCEEAVPLSCPYFVRQIANMIGLLDVVPVENQPVLIETEQQTDRFVDFLGDAERQMPVLLLTPCNDPKMASCQGYMLDADEAARTLYGWAHVFAITPDMTEYLIAKIGKPWAAFGGAVRTYYPGLDFDTMDYYDHPLVLQKIIHLKNSESEEENGFLPEIIQRIDRSVTSRKILWRNYGVEFFSTAYQTYLQSQRKTGTESAKLLASYKEQIEQLESQRDEYAAIADSYADDLEKMKKGLDEQQQTLGWQRSRIMSMQKQLEQLSGQTDRNTIPKDATYAAIPEWIDTYYKDRLFLHNRAKKSLKSAVFEDVNLVYRCLELLATDYYEYRLGVIDREEFDAQCRQVDAGLDESGAITDVQAGLQGDTYYVMYQGKRRKLERHLRKGGGGKDPRNQLRIYFFWDDERQLVVIGDLPEHLDTRAT